MKTTFYSFLLSCLLVCTFSHQAQATGLLIPKDRGLRPLGIKYHRATVKITDMTKDVETIYVREDGSVWVLNSNGMRDNPDGTVGVFDVFDDKGRFLREVTLVGEGDPELDGYYFVKDRLYIVTDLLQAAISLQSGGQSFDIGDEEPEPMSVICYQLADDVLSMNR